MKRNYRFAELNISIESVYDNVHRLAKDYVTDEHKTDFDVITTQENIDFERSRSERNDEMEGIAPRQFSDGYLETLAVYRKIAEKLPYYSAVLIHGSCVSVGGVGYLFTAKSGTGKSTHARLWREFFCDRAVMINDDKPLIRMTDEGPIIYGTPWDGKHRLSTNTAVPLKAICILERAEKNHITQVGVYEAYPMLLQQVYRPLDSVALAKTLPIVDKLADSASLWKMGCNMNIEAAKIAYEAMEEGTK